jgi:nucleoside-diphosphate-sugar epimerase
MTVAATNSGERVLVTGGTGFLGRKIVERLLEQGRRVRVLARHRAVDLENRGVEFACGSLDDASLVRAACADADTVFHVAAKVGIWGRYDDFYRTNVLGTAAILSGCHEHRVKRLVYTSTPSVVYNGGDLAGDDETLPLTKRCPSAYAVTKAIAEAEVLSSASASLATVALRPHLIWGVGDPHLVPRILARARAGKLRIVGDGANRVDMVHVTNAVDAHLLAEAALRKCHVIRDTSLGSQGVNGRAYFITNGEPVVLWDWINGLLRALGEPPVTKKISLAAARAAGAACELLWRTLPLSGEPPMTRFVASELARDHWFDITAARRDLGYEPRVSMAEGMAELVRALKR